MKNRLCCLNKHSNLCTHTQITLPYMMWTVLEQNVAYMHCLLSFKVDCIKSFSSRTFHIANGNLLSVCLCMFNLCLLACMYVQIYMILFLLCVFGASTDLLSVSIICVTSGLHHCRHVRIVPEETNQIYLTI